MRTIFASSARGNERVHAHNARNFPQAKLDSEINVRFLLNENGDLSFLLYFSKQCLLENIQGKFQKNSWVDFISEESP